MEDLKKYLSERSKLGPNGCIEWAQGLDTGGYGASCFRVDGKWERHAHHLGFYLVHGRLPVPDMVTDHLCRNRKCINGLHLEEVTHRENTLRGIGPTATNKRKTHCKRGHPLVPGNLYIQLKGKKQIPGRTCRTCNLENVRQQKIRKKLKNAAA